MLQKGDEAVICSDTRGIGPAGDKHLLRAGTIVTVDETYTAFDVLLCQVVVDRCRYEVPYHVLMPHGRSIERSARNDAWSNLLLLFVIALFVAMVITQVVMPLLSG